MQSMPVLWMAQHPQSLGVSHMFSYQIYLNNSTSLARVHSEHQIIIE